MLGVQLSGLLAVVRELQRDCDVLRVAQRLDHELKRVLVLADDAQLVALNPHLDLRRGVLNSLSQVARDVIRDAGVEPDLDLAAAFANTPGVARLEQLWRKLAACSLLAKHLEGGLGSVLAGGLDENGLAGVVVDRRRVFEVEAGADFAAGLVEGIGQLGGVELRDDVEGELRHSSAVRSSSGSR